MSEMQAVGQKERSVMDDLIIMSNIESERPQNLFCFSHMFFADTVKCFDKFWLKECVLEMYNVGYDPNTLRILHEMYKEQI